VRISYEASGFSRRYKGRAGQRLNARMSTRWQSYELNLAFCSFIVCRQLLSPCSLVELVTLVSGMKAQQGSVALINCVAGTSGPSLVECALRTTATVHRMLARDADGGSSQHRDGSSSLRIT
jgi:hypothetical protein